MQWILLAPKSFLLHVRRADQLAIQTVSPSVIRTLNPPGEPPRSLRAHASPAMPTHVIKSANRPRRIPGHDDALPRNVTGIESTWLLDLLRSPRTEPHRAKKPLQLLAEDL